MKIRKYSGWYRVHPGDELLVNDDYPGWTTQNFNFLLNRPLYPWKLVWEDGKWSYWAGQYMNLTHVNWWLGEYQVAYESDPMSFLGEDIVDGKRTVVPPRRCKLK